MVFVQPPTLVAVESGVWVVRDYDQAVYYVDDYYWRIDGTKGVVPENRLQPSRSAA